jgi:hypothetical protein
MRYRINVFLQKAEMPSLLIVPVVGEDGGLVRMSMAAWTHTRKSANAYNLRDSAAVTLLQCSTDWCGIL